MTPLRMLAFGLCAVIVFASQGCSGGTAEPEGQASADLRANLEASSKAASEVAKEKPKKTP